MKLMINTRALRQLVECREGEDYESYSFLEVLTQKLELREQLL